MESDKEACRTTISLWGRSTRTMFWGSHGSYILNSQYPRLISPDPRYKTFETLKSRMKAKAIPKQQLFKLFPGERRSMGGMNLGNGEKDVGPFWLHKAAPVLPRSPLWMTYCDMSLAQHIFRRDHHMRRSARSTAKARRPTGSMVP